MGGLYKESKIPDNSISLLIRLKYNKAEPVFPKIFPDKFCTIIKSLYIWSKFILNSGF